MHPILNNEDTQYRKESLNATSIDEKARRGYFIGHTVPKGISKQNKVLF